MSDRETAHRPWSARIAAVALLCTATPGAALAQADSAADCGALPQQPMNACFAVQAQRSQDRLEALLAELKAHLDSAAYDGLLAVQQRWTAYEDAQCRWQASFFDGGSIQPTIYWTCIDDLVWARIAELRISLCEGAAMAASCAAADRYRRPKRGSLSG